LGRGFAFAAVRVLGPCSAFNTRRTVVSEAPIPRNRFITSRIRRLPACGCAAWVARIAARRAAAPLAGFFTARRALASNPAAPLAR